MEKRGEKKNKLCGRQIFNNLTYLDQSNSFDDIPRSNAAIIIFVGEPERQNALFL